MEQEVRVMKDLYMIIVVIAIFFLGYDVLIRRGLSRGKKQKKQKKEVIHRQKLRIMAENHGLLEDLTPAIRCALDSHPQIKIESGCASRARIIEGLQDGSVDLAFLAERKMDSLPDGIASVCIPNQGHTGTFSGSDRSAVTDVVAVWDENRVLLARDQILQIIEDEQCMQNFGYCDYPN